MGIRLAEMAKEFRHDPDLATRNLRENLRAKRYSPRDFDLGRVFEESFGWQEFRSCRNDPNQSVTGIMQRHLSEAAGAVNTTMFLNITQEVILSQVLERYNSEEFVFSKIVPERRVTPGFLHGERMGGITPTGPGMPVRAETEPYALAGLGENWIFTPPVKDRGRIVPVTWEAVFQDRTGTLLEEAGNQGYWAGVDKENRIIDAIIDENTTDHRYNWRSLGKIETYNDNTGNHTWDNLVATNALVDHTDIDNAKQAFYNMVDPFTGDPIIIDPIHIIATMQLEQTVLRVLNSTEIITHIGGYAVTGNLDQMRRPNPFLNRFSPLMSRRLASRLATDTSWFIGDVTKLLRYMVAEPITVAQAAANNKDEFERRIVAQFRVNERGQPVVVEPRAMVKNTA